MPLKKIVFILLVIILLPALFYTGYEINSLSTTEKLSAEIYSRQMDAILFSVNQYAWDNVNSWASKLDVALIESQPNTGSDIRGVLLSFLEANRGVSAVFISDSAMNRFTFVNPTTEPTQGELVAELKNSEAVVRRVQRMKRVGYRKIESFTLPRPTGESAEKLVLMFVSNGRERGQLVGLVVDTGFFIQQVLAPKLQEVAGQEFILAIFQQSGSQPVYSTALVQASEIKQKRTVWLFPDHFLGIRAQGETFENLARGRFYRSLLLIVLLDILLLVGAWVVYRNVRREVELARLKSDFVSNVSHELKTPLSLIRMFAETLELGRARSEVKKKEYYRIIGQETERLTHLVNNLLNFSRMEAGKKQFQFQSVDVNAVIKKVLENYEFHLNEHGFDVLLQLTKNLPKIHADEEAVSEALLNLLDNAIKYSHAEKYLAVSTGVHNRMISLDVEDHGSGIAAEHHQKIFEKFYRVFSGLVHNTKGSGLGLTLVKHIMQAHGGDIKVSSLLGKGSRFRLLFPLPRDNKDREDRN